VLLVLLPKKAALALFLDKLYFSRKSDPKPKKFQVFAHFSGFHQANQGFFLHPIMLENQCCLCCLCCFLN
jgi:hypothetical protein